MPPENRAHRRGSPFEAPRASAGKLLERYLVGTDQRAGFRMAQAGRRPRNAMRMPMPRRGGAMGDRCLARHGEQVFNEWHWAGCRRSRGLRIQHVPRGDGISQLATD